LVDAARKQFVTIARVANRIYEVHDIRILECDPSGPPLAGERDVNPLMESAWAEKAKLIAIPAARLAPSFFQLKSGVAGAIIQKLVVYHFRVAIVGDIAEHIARSPTFADFVRETNRGREVWFVASLDELNQRVCGSI